MNIIFLRVSTNEKRQDLDQQLKAILDKFQLKDYIILKDQGSAYNMEKTHKRTGFLSLLQILFHAKDTSIYDIFLDQHISHNEDINLYVWDYSRIMRNVVKNLYFFLFAMEHNIRIYTYKDTGLLDENLAKTLNGKVLAIVNNIFIGMQAQAYSEQISKDIKRGYDSIKGGTHKGMIWGLGMKPSPEWLKHWSESITNNKGEVLERLSENGRLRMTIDEKKVFDNYIRNLIKKGYMRVDIIKMVEQNKGIIINHKYLSVNFRGIN